MMLGVTMVESVTCHLFSCCHRSFPGPTRTWPPKSHRVLHSQLRSHGDDTTFPPVHTYLQIQFFAVKFEQQFHFHVFIDQDRQACNHYCIKCNVSVLLYVHHQPRHTADRGEDYASLQDLPGGDHDRITHHLSLVTFQEIPDHRHHGVRPHHP